MASLFFFLHLVVALALWSLGAYFLAGTTALIGGIGTIYLTPAFFSRKEIVLERTTHSILASYKTIETIIRRATLVVGTVALYGSIAGLMWGFGENLGIPSPLAWYFGFLALVSIVFSIWLFLDRLSPQHALLFFGHIVATTVITLLFNAFTTELVVVESIMRTTLRTITLIGSALLLQARLLPLTSQLPLKTIFLIGLVLFPILTLFEYTDLSAFDIVPYYFFAASLLLFEYLPRLPIFRDIALVLKTIAFFTTFVIVVLLLIRVAIFPQNNSAVLLITGACAWFASLHTRYENYLAIITTIVGYLLLWFLWLLPADGSLFTLALLFTPAAILGVCADQRKLIHAFDTRICALFSLALFTFAIAYTLTVFGTDSILFFSCMMLFASALSFITYRAFSRR